MNTDKNKKLVPSGFLSVFISVHQWLKIFFDDPSRRRLARDLLLLAVFTLALHAPFLRQPVQGDEIGRAHV